jgi:AbrB family looped-hinge helix DNA binding protein
MGDEMARTRVSTKYQVVIPKEIRKEVGIRPGQELQVVAKGGTITLIPDRTIASMRGFVRGIRTKGFREKKDRV